MGGRLLGALLLASAVGARADVATDLVRSVGCTDFEARFWTTLATAPSRSELTVPSLGGVPNGIATHLSKLIDLVVRLAPARLEADGLVRSEILAALEMGDRTTPARRLVQNEIENHVAAIRRAAQRAHLACAAPARARAERLPQASLSDGGRTAMATIYQSCDVLNLPPLPGDEPLIEGITVTGLHPDGVGNKREITDRAAVLRTHYYLRSIAAVHRACRDMRVSPPIYDYGGKPAFATGALDFFSNEGSGTKVLGVDCSGYVFTAMAQQGMKARADRDLRADQVMGISSTMLSSPAESQLSCFARVKFAANESLKVGDLIASRGHVVIVDAVGRDPFGLARARRVTDCTPEVLTADGYDFELLQSGTSQGGVGVSRLKAAEYIPQNEKFTLGLLEHAVQACRARFGLSASVPKDAKAYVVRHQDTAACFGTPVRVVGAGCLGGCPLN